jgi:hypothetical protein
MSNWNAYVEGRSIGRVGSERGAILQDEELKSEARITLKRGITYISISCNIYGWIDHTCFFNTLADAQREYGVMKSEIEKIMGIITSNTDNLKGWEIISDFVRRFP